MELIDQNTEKSLIQITNKLVNSVSVLMKHVKSEEDLRIGFEKILSPILSELKIESIPRYERHSKDIATVYKGRPDAVHGLIIIEYEKPLSFKSKNLVEHANDQLIKYICAEASVRQEKLFFEDPKYIGVGFDGNTIFFTKYKGDKTTLKNEFKKSDFSHTQSLPFNTQSARTFLTLLRSLSRRPLTAEHLAESFGPASTLAPMAVQAFTNALENFGNERVKTFFNEWRRLFGIVYGEQFINSKREEIESLSSLYKVNKNLGFQELLFSVHTYYALLMKLIAAEILFLKETAFNSSFSEQLTHASDDELKMKLIDIENGGIYSKRGITNFLEGDFFSWYLDAWPPQLKDAIKELTRCLSGFEPATTIIRPEATRDLLKKLYQYLVPQEVRHKLGEYYTPDWLAELLINEVGYDGNTNMRFLDPACGSGTFLVLAIKRAKEYGKKNKETLLQTAKRISNNIWGFDLNPLAIIAARTNYLFALGDLINELKEIEIPVYLADSVLWPEKSGQLTLSLADSDHKTIQTSIGEFHVPYIWLKKDKNNISGYKNMMSKASRYVEEMVIKNYSDLEALELLKKAELVYSPHENVVKNFYNEIYELEKQGKNGIWARFLKNAFTPMIAERFDFVIGNPPWIRWSYLSKEYRDATLKMWQDYGLFSLKGHAARLGGGEKDFSMLFTYAAIDYYLKDKGKLGFLITQEVFKSKGAGEGFRKFRIGQNKPFKVLKALDLATVQPFEGASNKTSAIIVIKGQETTYPVIYDLYFRKKGVGRIPTDTVLEKALLSLSKKKLNAKPIGKLTGSWQTISESQQDLLFIEGKNYYQARRGVETDPYGIFLLEIVQVLPDGNLLIKNLFDIGKKLIQEVEEIIEPDFVYPLLRGSDIERWGYKPIVFGLIVQDPKTRTGYKEEYLKSKYPRTYGYLYKFKDELIKRATYKKFHEPINAPFYSQYNIAEYTFAPYLVVWKSMASDVEAVVLSQYKTIFGFRKIVPFKTTSFFHVSNENEAHYLCSIINSTQVREFIRSYSSAGRGFGAPSVMNHVRIPKYDPNNDIHQSFVQISKKLHNKRDLDKNSEIKKLEEQNDDLIKKLFGII